MAKNLQKTADFYRKQVGILDPAQFARHLHLRYFEPLPELAPLVAHYFVARWDMPDDTEYVAGNVLSGPAVHLVFKGDESSITGVTSGKLSLHLRGKGVYAGARFRPAGFYPFWQGRMSDLAEKAIPAATVFPSVTPAFTKQLLAQEDGAIADTVEQLLVAQYPGPDEKITLIQTIVATIEADHNLHTTSEVAKRFAMSERTLQQLFTTYVGVGIKWIIMRMRFLDAIERAHISAKPNWTTIAVELGYSTQSHFVNDFKKVMGQSPSQYAKTVAVYQKGDEKRG